MSANVSVQRIDALLPQTQCGKCGHPGCQPYAEGIAAGEAINKCPPGGQETVVALAQLLRVPVLPLAETPMPPRLAFIREDECIGCTKCIQACPVDAILGAAKLMHTVITDECTGCELCVAPCPVDCIDILPLSGAEAERQRQRAPHFRSRHQAHLARLARDSAQRQTRRGVQGWQPPVSSVTTDAPSPAGNSPVSAAVERDQLKRAKITLVNCRAALKKAERESLSGEPLAALRRALEDAQAALQHAEDDSGKAPPELLRTYPSGVDEQLRALKTELAYARADLTRLQRRKDVGASQLQAARQRLADAEQRLHDYHG